jgi:hypothetical protein
VIEVANIEAKSMSEIISPITLAENDAFTTLVGHFEDAKRPTFGVITCASASLVGLESFNDIMT